MDRQSIEAFAFITGIGKDGNLNFGWEFKRKENKLALLKMIIEEATLPHPSQSKTGKISDGQQLSLFRGGQNARKGKSKS